MKKPLRFRQLQPAFRPILKKVVILAIVFIFNIAATTSLQASPEGQVDDYYDILPLVMNPGQYSGNAREVLVESLIKEQGYEVHCAAKEWTIDTRLYNEHIADYFYNEYQGGTNRLITFEGDASYSLDAEGGRVPVYRNRQTPASKTSSYEAFFGALPPEFISPSESDKQGAGIAYRDVDITAPEHVGAANSLLSSAQQCQIKLHNLSVIDDICSLLSNPSNCRLNTDVRNSQYTRLSLYQELTAIITIVDDGAQNKITCEDLMGSWDRLNQHKPEILDSLNLNQTKFEELQSAVHNLSLDIENLYRIAFLVIAPMQNPAQGQEDRASFYENNVPEHAPIFIAFKIPDFLTNNSLHIDSSHALRRTLNTAKQQQSYQEKIESQQQERYSQVMNRVSEQRFQSGDPIYCPNMPECQLDINDPDSVIKNTLIDVINASSDRCRVDLIYEDAGDIFTTTDVDLEGTAFQESQFSFSPDFTDSQSKNFAWEFRSNSYNDFRQKLNRPDSSEELTINAYIVAPLGIEQDIVMETLMGTFFSDKQQQTLIEENLVVDSHAHGVYPEFFPLKNIDFGLETDLDIDRFSFIDETDCTWEEVCYEIEVGEEEKQEICYDVERCEEKEFGKGIQEDTPSNLLIYGAKVGWSLRKIQESISASGSRVHAYFSSCNRVEDMFLGRCGIEDAYGPPGGRPYAGSAPGTGWSGYGDCTPITNPDNPCSVDNLRRSLESYISDAGLSISDDELSKRATQASIVCNAESGGNPNALNDGCLTCATVDYSIGLFQINLLAHNCLHYFGYTWNPPCCWIREGYTQDDVDRCADPLFDTETNIRKAWEISTAGSDWFPWAVSRSSVCGPAIYSL